MTAGQVENLVVFSNGIILVSGYNKNRKSKGFPHHKMSPVTVPTGR